MATSLFTKISDRAVRYWKYCSDGVWRDTRRSPKVNIVKILNLSVRSFFNGDLQSQACAMTFRTILAIVPALALIFAFGRGFGLEEVIENELVAAMPSQSTFLREAFKYVDSYLDNSSEGIFLGIGIVFLLWTLVSLLSSVEDSFNSIWGIREGRSIWRKITDYLVIFILLPVLMVCASGVNVFVSTAVETTQSVKWLTPVVSVMLDFASLVLVWLFFTGLYIMVPNTKVKFRQALLSGVLAGTAFEILQWLFMTGQLYVSKYNAVYGGFAFLPLLLIWLQLVWVITFAGAVVCYASQNFSKFNFNNEIARMSTTYRSQVVLSIMTVSVRKYINNESPVTEQELTVEYGLPPTLVSELVNQMIENDLLLRVVIDARKERYGFVPSIDPEKISVGDVLRRMRDSGTSEFVPDFNRRFGDVVGVVTTLDSSIFSQGDKILISSLTVDKIEN